MDDFIGKVFWFIPVLILYGATKLVQFIFRRLAELETRVDALERRLPDGTAEDGVREAGT